MSRPLHEIAADWVMAEDAGAMVPEREAARDAWLAEHPAHVAAYDAVRGAMGTVDAVAADPRILALRASALSARGGAGPVWRMAAGIVGAVVLLGGGTAAVVGDRSPSAATAVLERVKHPGEAVYRTAVGERSTVTLPDGSVATLNTDTVLRVAYRDSVRGVQLVRGQALFEVAHAKARPFEVYAGDRVITAIGTTFDVRLDGGKVKVALLEGKVRVQERAKPAVAPTPQLVMAPGELLEARPAEPMKVRNEDLSLETSWRSGVLVFDETPLAQAVAELNRYSDRHLIVDDPGLGAFHVSGVFKTGDVDRFARTVAEILPVTPQAGADGSIKLSPRG
ncbi:MAG: FecR family protein [Ignavibacteriales bacterium]